jgi:DNA-binding transcriptional ArsR family regulator
MNANSLPHIAGLIGEAGRIQILTALLDGGRHPASELAVDAGLSPQTASSHLSKLLSAGLIACERDGRQRLFRLSNVDVAVAVEALGALSQQASATTTVPELRFARTCYDHLAGMLGVAVRDALISRSLLRECENDFELTAPGERLIRKLFDVDLEELHGARRSFARKCLDWTERRHHVGGALGAALLHAFFRKKWLATLRNSRSVRLTHEGELAFERIFGIRCALLRAGRDSVSAGFKKSYKTDLPRRDPHKD